MQTTTDRLGAAVENATTGLIGITQRLWRACVEEAEGQMGFAVPGGGTGDGRHGRRAGAATQSTPATATPATTAATGTTTRGRGRPRSATAAAQAPNLKIQVYNAMPEGRSMTDEQVYEIPALNGVRNQDIGRFLNRLAKEGVVSRDAASGTWMKIPVPAQQAAA